MLTVMATNEVTQGGLSSFDWTPQGTRALVLAATGSTHLPP